MGRLTRLFSVVSLSLALSAHADLVKAETLADALVSAYRESNLLDQNRALLRSADEDVAVAVSNLRPVIDFAIASNDTRSAFQSGLNTIMSLTGNLTLFDFGRNRLTIDITKELVLSTRAVLLDIEQQVLLDAVIAYMDVRSAIENVAISQNSIVVIGEELRAAQDRFSVGEVTRTDVAQAEARLASGRAILAQAEGQLTSALEAYKAATGHFPGTLAEPPPAPALPSTVDEAKAIALRSHPLITQVQHEVSAADLNVALATANRLPVVDGIVGVNVDDDGDEDSVIGLRLTQTIFSGGRLSAQHRQAIANRDASRASLSQAGVSVALEVGVSWSNIEVAQGQAAASEEEIAAATIAFNGVSEEAKLGSRTTLDVLDAEQELLRAEAVRIRALADLQVAYYSLLASMGLLTVEYLNLGIPTYDPQAYYNAVKSAPLTSVQGKSLDRVLQAIGKN